MPLLDKPSILRITRDFCDNSPENRVSPEVALRPELGGMRMFEPPIVGVAAADDPVFEEMLRPEIIGGHFITPRNWLPEARSVISYFLPFASVVIDSNRVDPVAPSDEWLHARIEGQETVEALGALLTKEIEAAGYRAVQPASDERFLTWRRPAEANAPVYTSNWSERHAAYACGLGTFGLSLGLITEKGTAGRFGSVVTTLPVQPDARPYARYDEYCTRCGECAKRCFAGAITLERGKDKDICKQALDETRIRYKPRYGCGKCHVDVPCERKNPKPRAV